MRSIAAEKSGLAPQSDDTDTYTASRCVPILAHLHASPANAPVRLANPDRGGAWKRLFLIGSPCADMQHAGDVPDGGLPSRA